MPITTINHKGREILFIDYTTCTSPEEMIAQLRKVGDHYSKSTTPILSLTDITGTYLNNDFVEEMKKLSKTAFVNKSEKAAVLGISGIKKIILDGFNLFSKNKGKMKPFHSKEEALDYLSK